MAAGEEWREEGLGAGGDLVGEGLADGDEGEPRVPRGVGRVEVGVEHGDAETPRAEEPRELEHRGGVALGREGEQYGILLLTFKMNYQAIQ